MSAWDRRKGEPPKAYAQFTVYRDMGPGRSLAKVGHVLGITPQALEPKSVRWGWVERADQWDAHLSRTATQTYVTEAEKQARQRAAGHSALFGKALALLKDIDSAKLSEIAAAMKVATDGMRVEAGLATAKVEHEVTTLTEEQRLARLDEILGRGEARESGEAPDAGRAAGSGRADRAGGVAVH